MATLREDKRLTFHEALELAAIPSASGTQSSTSSSRYIGLRPAWITGSDLRARHGRRKDFPLPSTTAYGGTVYAQSAIAACRTRESRNEEGAGSASDVHTIHGCFTIAGRGDRPFIYDATFLSIGRTFSTCLVNASQTQEAVATQADGRFTIADGERALGGTSFSCICTFKRPEPEGMTSQGSPPQQRYASILDSRARHAWPPTPLVDIDGLVFMFPNEPAGTFPIVDMKKVDMSDFNAELPPSERRELILYRLLAPLPKDDPNSHVLVHAFEADRNGILMAGNHLGLGFNLGTAASLSYSFYVHVNAAQAVMDFGGDEDDNWWIQEVSFPRAGSGRVTFMSQIWSPAGLHIATSYQDGVVRLASASKIKL